MTNAGERKDPELEIRGETRLYLDDFFNIFIISSIRLQSPLLTEMETTISEFHHWQCSNAKVITVLCLLAARCLGSALKDRVG